MTSRSTRSAPVEPFSSSKGLADAHEVAPVLAAQLELFGAHDGALQRATHRVVRLGERRPIRAAQRGRVGKGLADELLVERKALERLGLAVCDEHAARGVADHDALVERVEEDLERRPRAESGRGGERLPQDRDVAVADKARGEAGATHLDRERLAIHVREVEVAAGVGDVQQRRRRVRLGRVVAMQELGDVLAEGLLGKEAREVAEGGVGEHDGAVVKGHDQTLGDVLHDLVEEADAGGERLGRLDRRGGPGLRGLGARHRRLGGLGLGLVDDRDAGGARRVGLGLDGVVHAVEVGTTEGDGALGQLVAERLGQPEKPQALLLVELGQPGVDDAQESGPLGAGPDRDGHAGERVVGRLVLTQDLGVPEGLVALGAGTLQARAGEQGHPLADPGGTRSGQLETHVSSGRDHEGPHAHAQVTGQADGLDGLVLLVLHARHTTSRGSHKRLSSVPEFGRKSPGRQGRSVDGPSVPLHPCSFPTSCGSGPRA